jgi:hypothetical protein
MRWLYRVTAWEKASLWKRLLCAFGRVALLMAIVGLLIQFLGPPIAIFSTAKWVARKIPGVKVVPQPLANYSVSGAPGTTLSYFGYTFDLPWDTSFKEKALKKSGFVQLQFESGQNVTLIVPTDQSGLLTEIVQDKSMGMQNLRPIFGDLLDQAPYDQQAALLYATPYSVRAFGPRAAAIRSVTLLTIKAIATGPGLQTGVFTFELPDKRGFQVGDPRKSRRVDFEVFGMGGHHVEIICATTKEGIWLSQSELNRILTSIRPVSAASSLESPTRVGKLRK